MTQAIATFKKIIIINRRANRARISEVGLAVTRKGGAVVGHITDVDYTSEYAYRVRFTDARNGYSRGEFSELWYTAEELELA